MRVAFLAFALALLAAPASAQLAPIVSPNPSPFGGFGDALAVVPDTDGDGAADLFVGASYERPGGLNGAGRAYLLDGRSGAARLAFDGAVVQQRYGQAVAGIRDVTGDGRGDLLVYGGRFTDGGVGGVGRVEVRSGADGALVRTLVSPNPQDNGGFGVALASVPDTDGDGTDDVAVGAGRETVGGLTAAGRVYLFSGADGTLLRTVGSPNAEVGGDFGNVVAGLPDVTGDGRGDLLVGARSEDGGADSGGRAYVISGAAGTVARTLASPAPLLSGHFGDRIAALGDVDGDGTPDLAIGTRYETAAGLNGAGTVHVISGASGALLRTLTSPDAVEFGWFGASVSGAGAAGVLVGASLQTSAGGPSGDGVVYHMDAATGAVIAVLTSPVAEAGGAFGTVVAWAGAPVVSATAEDGGGIAGSGRVYGPFAPVASEATAATAAPITVVVNPNPARQGATVRVSGASGAHIDVFDVLGRRVASAQSAPFTLPRLPPGRYVVRASAQGHAVSQPLTVVR